MLRCPNSVANDDWEPKLPARHSQPQVSFLAKRGPMDARFWRPSCGVYWSLCWWLQDSGVERVSALFLCGVSPGSLWIAETANGSGWYCAETASWIYLTGLVGEGFSGWRGCTAISCDAARLPAAGQCIDAPFCSFTVYKSTSLLALPRTSIRCRSQRANHALKPQWNGNLTAIWQYGDFSKFFRRSILERTVRPGYVEAATGEAHGAIDSHLSGRLRATCSWCHPAVDASPATIHNIQSTSQNMASCHRPPDRLAIYGMMSVMSKKTVTRRLFSLFLFSKAICHQKRRWWFVLATASRDIRSPPFPWHPRLRVHWELHQKPRVFHPIPARNLQRLMET